MKTIVREGPLKILEVLYKKESYLREIARKADLNPNSTYRYLNEMLKEDIVKARKEGNQKRFSLKKNDFVYNLMAYIDIKKFQKLPEIRKQAINNYIQNLNTKPVFVILFGSTAKNTFNQDSDIDLLLVVNKKTNTKEAKKEVEAIQSLKINDFQIDYNVFLREIKLKEDKVIQSAINTGYPVYNQIEYHKHE
ncbi:hypothetical protein GF327_09290 [Candidatus Woesearchaeota archaeon]|nr:hypothetical protein [Candidatus Woesearchaeota archaeon]